jgi:hypothetical protein
VKTSARSGILFTEQLAGKKQLERTGEQANGRNSDSSCLESRSEDTEYRIAQSKHCVLLEHLSALFRKVLRCCPLMCRASRDIARSRDSRVLAAIVIPRFDQYHWDRGLNPVQQVT